MRGLQHPYPAECQLKEFHIRVHVFPLSLAAATRSKERGQERFTALLDCFGGKETGVSGHLADFFDLMIFFEVLVPGDETRPPLCSLKSNCKVSQEQQRKLNK